MSQATQIVQISQWLSYVNDSTHNVKTVNTSLTCTGTTSHHAQIIFSRSRSIHNQQDYVQLTHKSFHFNTATNELTATNGSHQWFSVFKSRLKTFLFNQAFTEHWSDLPPAPLKLQPYGAIEIRLLLLLLLLLTRLCLLLAYTHSLLKTGSIFGQAVILSKVFLTPYTGL